MKRPSRRIMKFLFSSGVAEKCFPPVKRLNSYCALNSCIEIERRSHYYKETALQLLLLILSILFIIAFKHYLYCDKKEREN